jgi:hypothetical protein
MLVHSYISLPVGIQNVEISPVLKKNTTTMATAEYLRPLLLGLMAVGQNLHSTIICYVFISILIFISK